MNVRYNFLTEETVYIAEGRAERPIEYRPAECRDADGFAVNEQCTFCAGYEHLTPPEIYKTASGRVRVVWNKYPFVEMPFGNHYVVIDTPNHDERIVDFTAENIAEIFQAAKHCFAQEYNNGATDVVLFKNDGGNAGASVRHSHWQIAALTKPAAKHRVILGNFRKYRFNRKRTSCFLCNELKKESYIVYQNGHFAAFCPYAPRFAHEINIAPKRHVQSLTELFDDEIQAFADALKQALSALNALIPNLNFNIYLNELPSDDKCAHLYLVIAPRIGSVAGFELSSGICTHAVLPETTVVLIKELITSQQLR